VFVSGKTFPRIVMYAGKAGAYLSGSSWGAPLV